MLEKAQKEDHSSLLENLNTLNNLNVSLKQQLKDSGEKLTELTKEREQMTVTINSLQRKLDDGREGEQKLQQRLKEVTETKMKFEQQFDELSKKQVEDESIIKNLKEELFKQNEKLKLETQRMEELSEEKTVLRKKCEDLSDQLALMSGELSQHKAVKDDLNVQIQTENQRYSEIVLELEASRKRVLELERSCQEIKKEKETWTKEKDNLAETLQIKIADLEAVTKNKLELETEVASLKSDNKQLTERCHVLASHETRCKELTEDLAKLHSQHEDLNVMRDKYMAVIEQLQAAELHSRQIEKECEEKCEFLNENYKKIDDKLAAASGLSEKFRIGDFSTSVESRVINITGQLSKAEDNFKQFKEELVRTKRENENLMSELQQSRVAQERMEKEKNEYELERDRMLEQYNMMSAELASTLLAIDREAQLSTHRRLTSDVGISVSTSTLLDHTDALKKGGEQEEKASVSEPVKKPNEYQQQNDTQDSEKISKLEKENKELVNEIEKLKTKAHNQQFGIKSLESEKSKLHWRVSELEVEKSKYRADQEKYHKEVSGKLDLQKQLSELKLKIHQTEDRLKLQEDERNHLFSVLTSIVQRDNADVPDNLKEVIHNLEPSTTNCDPQKNLRCTDYVRLYLSSQSENLQCLCEDLQKSLTKHLELLQNLDKLYEEKLQIEIENISLKAEIEKYKILKNPIEVDEPQTTEDTQASTKNLGSVSEHEEVRKELRRCQQENRKLVWSIEKNKVLSKLENLYMQSSKLNSQVSYVSLSLVVKSTDSISY